MEEYDSDLKGAIIQTGGAMDLKEMVMNNWMLILAVVVVIVIIIIVWMYWKKEGVTAGGPHISSNPLVAGEGYQSRYRLEGMDGNGHDAAEAERTAAQLSEWRSYLGGAPGSGYTAQWNQILGMKDCNQVNAARAAVLQQIGCSDVGAPLDCSLGGPHVDPHGNFYYAPQMEHGAGPWGFLAGGPAAPPSAAVAASAMASAQGPHGEGFSRKRERFVSDEELGPKLAGL